jgi:hypothetical protein
MFYTNSVLYLLKVSTIHLRALNFIEADLNFQITTNHITNAGHSRSGVGWDVISEAQCYTSAVQRRIPQV